MNNKISVIIPAYNVSSYIGKCLDTVLSQTYTDIEAIVINDGSTDGTAEIIVKFAADPRVKIINQKNAGVSAARNAGIDASSGGFITFVDSDDYIEKQMYEKLFAAIIDSGAEISVCDYNLVYDDHIDYKYSGIVGEVVNVSEDPADHFYRRCACPKPNNYIWTRLYKTDILKRSGVRFERYMIGDDTLFNFKLLPYIKKIAVIPDSMYNYFQRRDSNVYTVARRGNLADVYADTFDALAKHYKSNGFYRYVEILPTHAYTRLRSVIFYSKLAGMDGEEIADSIVKGFHNREIIKYLRDHSNIRGYAASNGFTKNQEENIKAIMRAAAENPRDLEKLVLE